MKEKNRNIHSIIKGLREKIFEEMQKRGRSRGKEKLKAKSCGLYLCRKRNGRSQGARPEIRSPGDVRCFSAKPGPSCSLLGLSRKGCPWPSIARGLRCTCSRRAGGASGRAPARTQTRTSLVRLLCVRPRRRRGRQAKQKVN